MKNIELKFLISLILIIAIFFAMFIVLANKNYIKYEKTLIALKNKSEKIKTLNAKVGIAENELQNKVKEVDKVNEKLKNVKIEADKISDVIESKDLILHIPSLLIQLEQNAIKNKLLIEIYYSEIKYNANKSSGSKDKGGISIPKSPLEKETKETKEIKESDKIEDNENIDNTTKIVLSQTGNTEGLNIAIIPIKISGDYFGIREFIKYLENIDYLAPYTINISSTGETSTGMIIIHVYSKEGV